MIHNIHNAMGFYINEEYDDVKSGLSYENAYVNINGCNLQWYNNMAGDRVYKLYSAYRVYANKAKNALHIVPFELTLTKEETMQDLCGIAYDHVKDNYFENYTFNDDI